ncbi:response regulator [Thermodesulfatator autotrophicus]|uniref:histidine kinase n=1 Tax=Thermodesulfatator autotrophicus TaxID=1795632 RepID=A0A177E7G8_9BACT|nr:response regulator [Thermodesulfatator autotrophicus]OAG27380.1 hypothetical protein TH606_07205 [Thermodesulfatator autotrophicus]
MRKISKNISLKTFFVLAIILSFLITIGTILWGTYILRQQLLQEREKTIHLLLRQTVQTIVPPLKYKIKSEVERALKDLLKFEFIKGVKVVWKEPQVYSELKEIDNLNEREKNGKREIFSIEVGEFEGEKIIYKFHDKSGLDGILEVVINDKSYQELIKNVIINFIAIGLLSATILCLVIYFFYYYATIPIIRLANHLREIKSENELTTFPDIKGPKEIKELLSAFNELVISINKYRRDLEKILEQWKNEAKRSESASQAKTRFLANVSHEIRTPMTAAIGMLEILKEEYPHFDKEKFSHLEKSIKSLKSLIDETLDFAKLEEGVEEIKEEIFDFREFINEIKYLFSLEIEKKKLDFEIFISPDIPKTFKGDVSKIRQILINLLSNAIKFTDKGKISLKIFPEKVGEKIVWLHISIKDTGSGIDPADLEKIFNPYERLDDSYRKPYPGTGLGLAISKRLAELLGGKLWAESEGIGKGATFHLLIPLKKASENRLLKKEIPHTLRGKILLAEDNPVNQLYFRRVLEKLGLTVVVASDGIEAFEKVSQQSFDLIILDIRMPGLNGLELVKRLRKKGLTIPILALTAHNVHEIEKEAFASGFDDFLQKPISHEELAQKLAKWLS